MKKLAYGVVLALAASPAMAGIAPQVPEMSAGPAIGAIALVIGAAAILRERNKKK